MEFKANKDQLQLLRRIRKRKRKRKKDFDLEIQMIHREHKK